MSLLQVSALQLFAETLDRPDSGFILAQAVFYGQPAFYVHFTVANLPYMALLVKDNRKMSFVLSH